MFSYTHFRSNGSKDLIIEIRLHDASKRLRSAKSMCQVTGCVMSIYCLEKIANQLQYLLVILAIGTNLYGVSQYKSFIHRFKNVILVLDNHMNVRLDICSAPLGPSVLLGSKTGQYQQHPMLTKGVVNIKSVSQFVLGCVVCYSMLPFLCSLL